LAKAEPRRVKVIDGSQAIAVVDHQIWELVEGVL
jgi:thymidylate kinase